MTRVSAEQVLSVPTATTHGFSPEGSWPGTGAWRPSTTGESPAGVRRSGRSANEPVMLPSDDPKVRSFTPPSRGGCGAVRALASAAADGRPVLGGGSDAAEPAPAALRSLLWPTGGSDAAEWPLRPDLTDPRRSMLKPERAAPGFAARCAWRSRHFVSCLPMSRRMMAMLQYWHRTCLQSHLKRDTSLRFGLVHTRAQHHETHSIW